MSIEPVCKASGRDSSDDEADVARPLKRHSPARAAVSAAAQPAFNWMPDPRAFGAAAVSPERAFRVVEPASPQPERALFAPLNLGFGAAAPTGAKPAQKVCPAAPKKNRAPISLFAINASQLAGQIQQMLRQQQLRATPIAPFTLTLRDGTQKAVTQILQTVIGVGQHSDVYFVHIDGSKMVLKLFNDRYRNQEPGEMPGLAGQQLLNYVRIRCHPELKNHVALDAALEPFVEEWRPQIANGDRLEVNRKGTQTAKTDLPGFLLAQYIPHELPKFSRYSPQWQQVQRLFELELETGIMLDIRASNLKVDADGTVKLIDLYEHGRECESEGEVIEDEIIPTRKERRATFFEDAETPPSAEDLEWLCPTIELQRAGKEATSPNRISRK